MIQQPKPLRIRYFNCQKGNDHDGQALNFVCIDKNCKERGLVCSICVCEQQKHNNHNIIPLKILLQKLQHHQQKPIQSENLQDHIGQIQNLKNSILYQLKLCVENVAEKFRQAQKQIIEDFAKTKVQLMEQIELNMKFSAIIESALNSRVQDQEAFTQDMNRIANLVQITDLSKGLTFEINLAKIVNNYKAARTQIGSILENVQKNIRSTLDLSLVKGQALKIAQPIGSITTIFDQVQNTKYTFSSKQKGSHIKLEKNNKIAKQGTNGVQRFVLVNQNYGLKNQKIIFKVLKLKNWIGLGIGIRNNLKDQKYQFNYSNLGHGSYLLSSNGFTWSHTQKADNIVSKDFSFSQGDIVEIQLKQKEIEFKKRKDGTTLSIKIELKQTEWPEVCFCANLCSPEDSVEIIDNA